MRLILETWRYSCTNIFHRRSLYIFYLFILQTQSVISYAISYHGNRYCFKCPSLCTEVINSVAPGRLEWISGWVIWKIILMIGGNWWMPLNRADDLSMLVQVMAWCRQATNHTWANSGNKSLSEPILIQIYVTGPQWVRYIVGSLFQRA